MENNRNLLINELNDEDVGQVSGGINELPNNPLDLNNPSKQPSPFDPKNKPGRAPNMVNCG